MLLPPLIFVLLPFTLSALSQSETILIADIGGTNARFRLYEMNGLISEMEALSTYERPYFSQRYFNNEFKNFQEVLERFFHEANHNKRPVFARISVAGPIKRNNAVLTNRGWIINAQEVAKANGIRGVTLMNDFVASGYGLLNLNEIKDCVVIQDRPKVSTAPKALIGAGTGLGQCFLTANAEGKYTCYPSEGGHAEFSPHVSIQFIPPTNGNSCFIGR